MIQTKVIYMKIMNMLLATMAIASTASTIFCGDFGKLKEQYSHFTKKICQFPTTNNTIIAIAGKRLSKNNIVVRANNRAIKVCFLVIEKYAFENLYCDIIVIEILVT